MHTANSNLDDETVTAAAEAIRSADAVLVTAGAGMGVDSGLPDFRGSEGFWRAYPPYRALGLQFEQLANPANFSDNPQLAWGFYGHRLNLYRATEPHGGFEILRRWSAAEPLGGFVFTSNVDGNFQKAGFDPQQVVECHGSILHLQCAGPCCDTITPAGDIRVEIDESTMLAADPLPVCRSCGELARPNILMFGDWNWIASRAESQESLYERWLDQIELEQAKLVVIECGAGTAIPTVRRQSESVAERFEAPLIRINVREAHGPAGTISLAAGALASLRAIDSLGI